MTDDIELLALAVAGIISPRLARALVRDGKRTVADLAKLSPAELMTIPNVGPKGLAIIGKLVADRRLAGLPTR
jgi:hypothetical protein